MPIFYIVLVVILVGVGLYVVNEIVPMDAKVKKILNLLVILILLVWLFYSLVGFDHLDSPRPWRRC